MTLVYFVGGVSKLWFWNDGRSFRTSPNLQCLKCCRNWWVTESHSIQPLVDRDHRDLVTYNPQLISTFAEKF